MSWISRLRRTSYDARGAAIILLFHRVAERTSLAIEPETVISRKFFHNIISDLAVNYIPVSMESLASKLRRGEKINRCVAVTFDDGFRDNLTTALPILEEFRVPATVYVTSGFMGRDVQPLEYELAQIVTDSPNVAFDDQGESRTWNTESIAEKRACYESIRQILKHASRSQRDESIEKLWQGLDRQPAPPQFELLTGDELRKLDASPLITIGAHTHAHQVLTAVSPQQAKEEIRRGKQWLEKKLRHRVVDFAYPYGAFDQEVQQCVRRAGFRTAVTTVSEQLRGRCDLFSLPRFEVNARLAESTDFFTSLLSQ